MKNRIKFRRQNTPPDQEYEETEDIDIKISTKALPMPNQKVILLTFFSLLFLSLLYYIDFNTGHNIGDFESIQNQLGIYHQMHQKEFKLTSGVIFSSKLNGGNLLYIHEKNEKKKKKNSEKKENKNKGFHFYLGISDDCCDSNPNSISSWFNFKVTGLPQGLHTFTIANINFSKKIFKSGIVPVYNKLGSKTWGYIREFPVKLHKHRKSKLGLTWKHMFLGPKDSIQFAFHFPWTFIDNNNWILETLTSSKNLYFHTEVIFYNSANAPIEAIHVSNYKGLLKDKRFEEDYWKKKFGIFPEDDEVRPSMFKDKKYVIVTARSLAFGSPSSFVLKGLVESFIEDAELGKKFFDEFVLVFLPMINPDGVEKGQTLNTSNGGNFENFFEEFNKGYIEEHMKTDKKKKKRKKEATKSKNKGEKILNPVEKIEGYLNMIQSQAKVYAYIELRTEIEETKPRIYLKNFSKVNKFGALCIPYLLTLHHKRWKLSKVKQINNSKKFKNREFFFKSISSEKAYLITINFWGKTFKKEDEGKVIIGDRRYVRGVNGRYSPSYFWNFGRDISRVLVDSAMVLSGKEGKEGALRKIVEDEISKIKLY